MTTNRLFALILLGITGFCSGVLLVLEWRLLAIALVAGLSLLLGINIWRGTWAKATIDTTKGFWRIKMHPAIIFPVVFLAAGGALAGLLMKLI